MSSAKPGAIIAIRHNFAPEEFMWLWSKYVLGFNEKYHCTNCLRGAYSNRFSKTRNPGLAQEKEIVFDERDGHTAIYICGVARQGYGAKKNYPHNVHIAIQPSAGSQSVFEFEKWKVEVVNGIVLPIPGPESLPRRLQSLPSQYTTCRIFRWCARHFERGGSG